MLNCVWHYTKKLRAHFNLPKIVSELVADLKVNPCTEPKTHNHKHYSTVKDAESRQG